MLAALHLALLGATVEINTAGNAPGSIQMTAKLTDLRRTRSPLLNKPIGYLAAFFLGDFFAGAFFLVIVFATFALGDFLGLFLGGIMKLSALIEICAAVRPTPSDCHHVILPHSLARLGSW